MRAIVRNPSKRAAINPELYPPCHSGLHDTNHNRAVEFVQVLVFQTGFEPATADLRSRCTTVMLLEHEFSIYVEVEIINTV